MAEREQHRHRDESTPQRTGEGSLARKTIAVIVAHPDDAEFICAGTVAKWADEGHDVFYVVVTNGDKGSHDPTLSLERLAEIREAEQRAAAAILGVRDVVFLRRSDGFVVADLDLRRELVRVIRRLRPDTVVCGDPTVYWVGSAYINHPDHRATAEVTLAALYPAAGNWRFFPELLEEGLKPHKVKELYMAGSREPDTWIDVTPYMDKKIAALRAHASQMGDWDPEEMVRQWCAEDGKRANPPVPYAESFRYFTPEG